jgi:long-chain acyl-CoA synthetase
MNLPVLRLEKVSKWPCFEDGGPATLMACLARNALQSGRQVAIRERDYGIWQELTWRQVYEDVLAAAAALEQLGLAPGQAVTIIGDNRYRLYVASIAATALKAFPAPVFPDVPPEELVHYTRYGTPTVAIAEDQEQVDKLLELRERHGRPQRIVYDDPRGLAGYKADGLISMDALLADGRKRLAAEPGLVGDLVQRSGASDLAVLLHSSGTTGVPKGVPLSHENVLQGVRNAAEAGYFESGENCYAYLPMAWVGDFVFTLTGALALRFVINIPERQETVLHDLREVTPTMYLAAPRAWDNMLTRVQVAIADSTPLKRWLFNTFMPRAIEIERRRIAGKRPRAGDRVVRALGEIVIFGPLKDFLGLSRAARAYTGGESIGEDTFLFFRALGVNLRQFYGQTETSALTAAQLGDDVKLHTVGKPLPNVEIRIDDSGEILVRSRSVITGYYNDAEATKKALTDGWLHTGDAGYFEPDGHLVVLGRVSEVVRTRAGERYIPNYIENRLKFSPHVRNVAVLGAGRDTLAAIVCIDYEAVGHWAEARGISYTSYAELSQRPEVYDLITGDVRHVNGFLKEPLKIRRFVNLHKDFDPDDGEITRTRKIRRNVVEERYASLIDALYSNATQIEYEARITYESGDTGLIRRTLALRNVD